MAHLLHLRAATAAGAHISTYRGCWLPAAVNMRRTVAICCQLPQAVFVEWWRRSFLTLDDPQRLMSVVRRSRCQPPEAACDAFKLLANDLASAAPSLSFWARIMTWYSIYGHLLSHRILQEDLQRHPEVTEEMLRPPVFVMGLPRTGSTLLHHLLALDPDSQCLRAYELLRPVRSLSGRLPAGVVDLLDWAKLSVLFRFAVWVAPQWPHHHDLDASSPEECLFALQRDMPLDTHYRARSHLLGAYSQREHIPEQAYQRYRLFLQQVQLRRGSSSQHYVLKGQLLHLQYLNALRQAFPEAKLVWTHRPPSEVVGSLCSLRRSQQEVFTTAAVDTKVIGQGVLEYLSGALDQAQEALAQSSLPTKRLEASATKMQVHGELLVHVQYRSLLEAPLQVVEDIYASWGWKVSEKHREAMVQYLEKSNDLRSRRGKDRSRYHDGHQLARYGLSDEGVRKIFADKAFAGLATAFADTSGVLRHSELPVHKI